MSNDVFPSLPGLKWDVKKTPVFATGIQQSVSGRELRTSYMSYPLWRFGMQYEVLRADSTNLELQKLQGFFLARQGMYDTFLFNDTDDNAVTDQVFGTGNAVTTAFQLVRTYGSGGFLFTEPVYAPNSVTAVKVAGVTKTVGVDYTVGSTGIITFTAAPAGSASITWTGTFYFRCRFMQDLSEFNKFSVNLWDLKKMEFMSVKL